MLTCSRKLIYTPVFLFQFYKIVQYLDRLLLYCCFFIIRTYKIFSFPFSNFLFLFNYFSSLYLFHFFCLSQFNISFCRISPTILLNIIQIILIITNFKNYYNLPFSLHYPLLNLFWSWYIFYFMIQTSIMLHNNVLFNK